MNGVIHFDLPEEEEAFDLALKGPKYAAVLHDFDQHLRGLVKYNTSLCDEEVQMVELLRRQLHDFIAERNLPDL